MERKVNVNANVGRVVAALLVVGMACNTAGTEPPQAPSTTEQDITLKRRPCASSSECGAGRYCTTEDGVCDPPPYCRPGQPCPDVCYGTCVPRPVVCGPNVCPSGQVCCNESCGICTPPGGTCTQQICEPPGGRCRTDADCRTFSDYCTGCDCRALSLCQKDPVCPGPGVLCFVDPCFNQEAFCAHGRCQLRRTDLCPPEACGPPLGLPNRECPDGSVAGPTDRCLRGPDGTCGWEIRSCPDPSICAP